MGLIRLSLPWDAQPPHGTPIDREHPLAIGLVDALIPAHMVSASGIVATPSSTGTVTNGAAGMARLLAADATRDTYVAMASMAPPLSHFVLYRLAALPAGNARITGNFRAAVGGFGLVPSAANFRAGIANSGNTAVVTGSAISTAMKADVQTVDAAGTTLAYYENGALSGTASLATTMATLATSPYHVGADHGSAVAANAEVYLCLVWNRTLSAEEAAAIAANPWQIFEPRVYSVQSGSAGSSGVLVASEAGQDTAASAGVVLVSGLVSAIESDGDAAAFVVKAFIVGAIAAAESGADAAAVLGAGAAASRTGSIAAVEAASDSALIFGPVLGTNDTARYRRISADILAGRCSGQGAEVFLRIGKRRRLY